jgi:signal transduction histidine kinase
MWTSAREDDWLVLALDDSGTGIPEDELPLATNHFFRGGRKSSVGSGLVGRTISIQSWALQSLPLFGSKQREGY